MYGRVNGQREGNWRRRQEEIELRTRIEMDRWDIVADTGMNLLQIVEAAKNWKGWRSIVQAVARCRHRHDSTR